jgi:hypothetical protein
MLQKIEFLQNLTEMRLTSMKHGNSKMTRAAINAEINAARKERVKQKPRASYPPDQ